MDRLTGYGVAEAARRLDCSEATIRRDLKKGVLVAIAEARPLQLTRASVDEALQAKLTRMGVAPPEPPPSDRDQAARIVALEAEVTFLKGALEDLTAAHSAVIDTFRRVSSGGVPNH